jgi:hypothetical protein
MFPQKILTFHSWENIYWKFICLLDIWIILSQKQLAKSQSQIRNIYFRKGNNKFMFGNMLFPILKAEWLHLVLYFYTENHYSRKNIIILYWNYLVDIRSEAWLNIFWNTQIEKCLQCICLTFTLITRTFSIYFLHVGVQDQNCMLISNLVEKV